MIGKKFNNIRSKINEKSQLSKHKLNTFPWLGWLLKDNLVSVIMTTYNSSEFVGAAIESVLSQTHQNFELIVVDDASTDNTFDIVKEYASHDARILPLQNFTNRGTYWCKNLGLTQAKGEFVTTQDSDDISLPNRLIIQLQAFALYPRIVASACDYVRKDENGKLIRNRGKKQRIAIMALMWRRACVLERMGYFDSVRTSADAEFYHRLKLVFGESRIHHQNKRLYICLHREGSLTNRQSDKVELRKQEKPASSEATKYGFLPIHRQEYVHAYMEWHSKINNKQSVPSIRFPQVDRPFKAPDKMSPAYGWDFPTHVTASLASFPLRKQGLEVVIESLLPQVNELRVHLNNYEQVPRFLCHPKIHITTSSELGDLRDNGKFASLDSITPGYHFTVDDDIFYPPDYVSTLLLKLQQYDHQAIIGVHGIILSEKDVGFYQDRTVYKYNRGLKTDKFVNLLGSGTLAYHTSTFRPSFSAFGEPGMADLWFAIAAKTNFVPMICIQRQENWLKDLDEAAGSPTLYSEYAESDSLQTMVAKGAEPWSFVHNQAVYTPLKEKLLGRFSVAALKSRGVDANFLNALGVKSP